jgi:hypothetical protein
MQYVIFRVFDTGHKTSVMTIIYLPNKKNSWKKFDNHWNKILTENEFIPFDEL